MLWKERHTSIGGGLRWLGSRPIVLFFSVLLGCYLLDVGGPVVLDAWNGREGKASRMEVTEAVRGSSMALAILGMLGIAASAAVSVTGEREQDTWISLATTLLTPGEIVRAKQFGAVWSARRVGLALVVVWALGLLLGAIHPLGVLAAALYLAAIAWLVAAWGVCASSLAKNSTRALVATFIVVLISSALSRWPMVLWGLLFSYRDLPGPWSQSPRSANSLTAALSLVFRMWPLVVVPALAAAVLTTGSLRRLRATWGR